jgi:hypothetical protein
MPSCEEYRKRAKEARQEANVCRDEWERQRLLTIADQCERIAAYKDLTNGSVAATGRARNIQKPTVSPPPTRI